MSGQDTKTPSAIMAENQKVPDTSNEEIQKYLLNMGIGLSSGKTLQEGLSAGLSRAGEGMLAEMNKKEHKKIVKDVLGDKDLSSLSPAELNKISLDLIGSGDPAAEALGQHILTSSLSKTPTKQFVSSTQSIGGKDVPGQIDVSTGQFTPYSSDIVNGPAVSYIPELGIWADKYGRPTTPSVGQMPNVAVPQGQAPIGQTVPSPVPNLTDQSINAITAPAGKLPTPSMPSQIEMPSGLTYGKQQEFLQQQATKQQDFLNKQAEAQAELGRTASKEKEQVTGKAQGEDVVTNQKLIDQYNYLQQNREHASALFNAAPQGPVSGTLSGPLSKLGNAAAELGIKTDLGTTSKEQQTALAGIKSMQSDLVASLPKPSGNFSDSDLKAAKEQIGSLADPGLSAKERMDRYDELMKTINTKVTAKTGESLSSNSTKVHPLIDPSKIGNIVEKGGKKWKITSSGYEEL